MRLRNLLVGVRDIGALIGTPARRHLANQGSKTAEKGQSDAAQQGYQRTILHNKLQPSRNEMPEKWCFQGTSCEANSLPWKSRLGNFDGPDLTCSRRRDRSANNSQTCRAPFSYDETRRS